jgi:hypothetical protein
MKVVKVNFPAILPDNETVYFSNLQAYVESIDHEGVLRITKNLQGINVRIAPSHPQYLRVLLKDIKTFHTMFGLEVLFSKSMKTSMTINFDICF